MCDREHFNRLDDHADSRRHELIFTDALMVDGASAK